MPNTTAPVLMQDLIKQAAQLGARRITDASDPKVASATAQPSQEVRPEAALSTDLVFKLAEAVECSLSQVASALKVADGSAPPPGAMMSNAPGEAPGPNQQGQARTQVPGTGVQSAQPGDSTTQIKNDRNNPPGGGGMQTTALTAGTNKNAFLEVPVAAALGAHKAPEGERLEGAARGGGGYLLGAIPGGLAGGLVGGAADHMMGGNGGLTMLGAGLGGLAGGVAGYKHLTRKYNEPEALPKEAAALYESNRAVFAARTKAAEDAINPARISAGPAKPPETNVSGQSVSYAGGPPQGPTHLIASNQAAINATRGQAYAPRKVELRNYFSEPALSSSTDRTLQQSFAHTSQAGPKIAMQADLEGSDPVKVAAARLVIERVRANALPPVQE